MCQNMIDCPSLLHELITFSSLLTIYHIKIVAKLWHKRLLSYIFSTISCVFIYIYIEREREREREAILSILGLQNWAKIPIPL